MSLTELYSDPNSPGLMVCREDLDDLDPYRLPARETERINLDFVRPDIPIAVSFVDAAGDNTLIDNENINQYPYSLFQPSTIPPPPPPPPPPTSLLSTASGVEIVTGSGLGIET